MRERLNNIKNLAIAQIINASEKEELDRIKTQYLGKNGELNQVSKSLSSLSREERSDIGKLLNDVKKTISETIDNSSLTTPRASASPDITLPGFPIPVGFLHPTTVVIRQMNSILKSYGFSVIDGPEIETEEYNFSRLNLPPDHPARDLQDTIYIEEPSTLLRTHTSSVEARVLENLQPPLRVVIPGKCYRYENANSTNHYIFNQYQAVVVGENVTMANLFATIETFFKHLYGEGVKIRFRQKYYPEVEPGVGPDMLCTFCQGKGCQVCKYRGWIEMGGAGMIHPNILKKVGIDPQKFSGFAWGMGLDRFVMTKFGISDIRSLYNGDISYSV